MNEASPKPKMYTLVDYMIRHDLATMLEEAQADYSQSVAGGPRLLSQEDIAARFRKVRPPAKPGHD
jgi:hypothetical protein